MAEQQSQGQAQTQEDLNQLLKVRREKLAQLKEYSRDEELRQAGRNAALRQADYRLIHFFMYRGQVRTAYLLCVLRAQAVRLLRAVRGREKV